mgnify:CR=1 FL=1
MRSYSEHAIRHIMDRVVASKEGVTKKEEVLLIRDYSQSAYSAVLVLRSVKYIVRGIHDIPVLIKHELKGAEFTSLSAVEGKEAILDLVLCNAELLD